MEPTEAGEGGDVPTAESSTGEDSTSGAHACSEALLGNPSFEDWNTAGLPGAWSFVDVIDLSAPDATIEADEEDPRSGARAARIVVAEEESVALLQRIDTPYPAGTRFAAEFSIRRIDSTSPRTSAMLLWGGINDIHELAAPIAPGAWISVAEELVLIDDAPFLNVWVELPSGTFAIDDVNLYLCGS